MCGPVRDFSTYGVVKGCPRLFSFSKRVSKRIPSPFSFLLEGPERFHPMKPTDLVKNSDQLYRLPNIPARIYVVQHYHTIGAAIRKQAETFALARSFVAPFQIVFMDGITTAHLLRAHDLWLAIAPISRRGKAT